MTGTILHSLFIPHSTEEVWEYLTKTELISQWLMENDFLPQVGHDFQFRTRPMPNFDFDGIVYCKVLEIVPYKKVSYSWKGGPGGGRITLDSLVLWTLEPKEGGTELLLTHTGFQELENFGIYSLMNTGWLKNMQKIDGLLIALLG
jgi:uncharacterized protein YndB with AHSA1/START domain